MRQQSFSAQELYCMALAGHYQKMVGLPDMISVIPDEERNEVVLNVNDELMKKDVLQMDFDGKLSLSPEYIPLAEVYCCCEKCLTVNLQHLDGSSADHIFWLYEGSYYQAVIEGEQYSINKTTLNNISELVTCSWENTNYSGEISVVIPQVILNRAKQETEAEKPDNAVRLLRQNGADERTAVVLVNGLQKKADYIGLLLMDYTDGECKKTEIAFLNACGVTLAMRQTVEYFRTCVSFTGIEAISAELAVQELLQAFLRR